MKVGVSEQETRDKEMFQKQRDSVTKAVVFSRVKMMFEKQPPGLLRWKYFVNQLKKKPQ